MKTINSIKQAEHIRPDGKLQYFSTQERNLKLRILPNGTKDWVLRYSFQVNGKRHQKTQKIDPFDQRQKINDILKKAAKLKLDLQSDTTQHSTDQNKNLTLNFVWNEYISSVDYRANTNATKLQKLYSFNRYRQFFEQQGLTSINEITTPDVTRFQTSRCGSPVASNRDLAHMSSLFQFCIKQKYLTDNPVQGVKKEREARGSHGILVEQIPALFEMLENYPTLRDHQSGEYLNGPDGQLLYDPQKEIVANFTKFLVLTGLRVSEARLLTFNQNADANFIQAEPCSSNIGNWNIFVVLNKHKTKTAVGTRKLQLLDAVKTCLPIDPPFYSNDISKHGHWVFPNKLNNGPISEQTLKKFILEIRNSFQSAGADKPITFRSLRHTFAHWAIEMQLSHDDVANLLGHTTTNMIRKHYAPTNTAQTSLAINKLSAAINQNKQNEK